jgi:Domain of unknown function (DUF397)
MDLTHANWHKSSYSSGNGGACVEVAALNGVTWRKSSYSSGNGGNCVEVGANWQKSSFSGANGGNCVEVAGDGPGVVAVRDSKDPDGPALVFSPADWSAFISSLKG